MGGGNRDRYNFIEVTPTVSASSAYEAGDQVGGIQTLTDAVPQDTKTGALLNITVIDEAAQSAALVIYFFDELPTVASSDNAALNITDAEVTDKCIGQITIAAADYDAISGSSIACVPASSSGIIFKSQESGGNIYAVVKTTGTPTYGGTDDLTFKYAIIYG